MTKPFVLALALTLACSALSPALAQEGPLEVVEIKQAFTVDRPLALKDKHLRIHGDLVLAKGGELKLENCICELMCTYSREFLIKWRGGVLRTEGRHHRRVRPQGLYGAGELRAS